MFSAWPAICCVGDSDLMELRARAGLSFEKP